MKRLIIPAMLLTGGFLQAMQIVHTDGRVLAEIPTQNAAQFRVLYGNELLCGPQQAQQPVGQAQQGLRVCIVQTGTTLITVPEATSTNCRIMFNNQVLYQPSRFRLFMQGAQEFGKGLVFGGVTTAVGAVSIAQLLALKQKRADAKIYDELVRRSTHKVQSLMSHIQHHVKPISMWEPSEDGSFVQKIVKPLVSIDQQQLNEQWLKPYATELVRDVTSATTSMAEKMPEGALFAGLVGAISNACRWYKASSKAYICGLLVAPVGALIYGATAK